MTYNFDSEKERTAAKKLLKRLSIGSINDQQALNFMRAHTDYKDERSFKNFLESIKNSDHFPVKKKGGELQRTDMMRGSA